MILYIYSEGYTCVVHVFRDSFTAEEDDIYNVRYRIKCPELLEFLNREAQKGETEGSKRD